MAGTVRLVPARSPHAMTDQTPPAEAVGFDAVLDRFVDRDKTHYIAVPDDVAQQFTRTSPVRMMCLLNGTIEFHCALRPRGDGTFFINIGTPLRQQGKLRLGDRVRAVIWKDESEYGRNMPEELVELFAIDPEGHNRFHALTPGKQRGIMYYINSAKNPQTRVDRAIKMIDRLKTS
ncbi:YdeI/OmpD-associated family protein [Larkinella sp. VNQ87]|uniref:YdeI/OmpD-associated family protein n=1 Tax=Larkinella sp. VNQ87 TaxID=3400921 RepID=UPI003C05EF7C